MRGGFESGSDKIFCVSLVEMFVESFAVLRWNLSKILVGRSWGVGSQELSGHNCDTRLDHPNLHAAVVEHACRRLEEVAGHMGWQGGCKTGWAFLPCTRPTTYLP